MSSNFCVSSSFPGNSSSFDNPDTYPDVEFVIPGFEKPFRLHTEILSKASLAFAHMFKGNDLAFCKFDQGAHRAEWTDEKASSDKTYRSVLERVLRFCYGNSLTATADELPVLSSIIDQIQVQGKDTIKQKMDEFVASEKKRKDEFVAREKRRKELAEKEAEKDRKETQEILRRHPSLSRSPSYRLGPDSFHHSDVFKVLKSNATPTKTLSMFCFNVTFNAFAEKETDFKDSMCGKELAEALNTNTTLTSLTVSVHPEGADAICKSLQTNKTLTFLSIGIPTPCEDYGKFGEQLEPMVRINSTLKTLDIYGAVVADCYAKPFCDALKTCHTLETLKYELNSGQAEPLGEALESNHAIKELGLHLVGLPTLKPIGQALKTNSTLTKLGLRSSDRIGGIVGDLAEGFASNHSVTSLDLGWMIEVPWNRGVLYDTKTLGAQGARCVAKILEANSTLTTLNLFNTGLRDEGVSTVVDGLRKNTSIRELNLGYNGVEKEGMKPLFELLKTNKTITSLDVSYTKMDKKVIAMIADVLKVNTSLKELNLSCCNITEKPTKMIMEALRVNTTLTSLKYKGNWIHYKVCSSFEEFLKTSKTIKDYEIDYISGEDDCVVM